MYSEEDIDAAVSAGVLNQETATAFRNHVALRRRAPAEDDEHFRLLTGFNDIFVVIACLLLLASVAWIGAELKPVLGAVGVAACSWGLAEYFTRRRLMALPSIVLLLTFAAGMFATGCFIVSKVPGEAYPPAVIMTGGALSGVGVWLHWLRFQVPMTVAAGVAALICVITALLLWQVPAAREWLPAISFIAGLGVFTLACAWDAADVLRRTRKSDVAFWLHLLAAPLLVHPVFTSLGVFSGETTLGQAMAVLGLYVAIALISLCIDRRALMISALAYVLYTFSALLKQYGVVSLSFAFTALAIGSSLLLLSAFWHPARGCVLRFVPPAMKQRLAPCRP